MYVNCLNSKDFHKYRRDEVMKWLLRTINSDFVKNRTVFYKTRLDGGKVYMYFYSCEHLYRIKVVVVEY